ncbi:MAG: twin-arginine translocase subunit TatC [Bacillota bacterium]
MMKHLDEIRKVLTISILAVLGTSLISFFVFGERLFNLIIQPLTQLGVKPVYIGITEAFMTRLKISLLAGVILALPVIMWQLWSFILPALHGREKRTVIAIVPVSTLLFILGAGFAYTTVFRFAIRFLLLVAGEGLIPMLSIGKYVSFLISFTLPFGLIFELPLVIYFLTRFGLITPQFLVRNRKYSILIIFIAAAVLTPGPDVVSQLLMAGPMVLLYEISIIISKLVKSRPGLITDK